MSTTNHTITTGLDIDTAKKAIDKAFAAQKEQFPQYKPEFSWADTLVGQFSFKPTASMEITGKLTVFEENITLSFDKLPFLANMFKGTAIKMVEKEVQVWVEKAKNGQLDA